MHIINQISSLGICRNCEMERGIEDLRWGSSGGQVHSNCVNNKANIMFFCYVHLNNVAISKMSYDCTSLDEKDFYFDSLQKRFSVGCIRHFCQKFCSLFPFVDFDFIDFNVNS